ncbi:MAG: HD domain-containing protein [Candidatus Mcinerneyibacterium aminivorans]|uniref:HD domain-containing protein n=1 Tax=Candidatus Mcinerneyibacterium aminivorans TaxID=2703815 RepID=A0A5D0MCE6_9BACT|nr:MAG: HD domain-containing protein [Candidatus Mcinerneyibacterium aminivorans]
MSNTINYGNLLLSLSDAIDLASKVISCHQQRVAYISWEISKAANLSQKLSKDIFIASLLHDAGAITVEEKISINNFDSVNTEPHCIKGKILLSRIPKFRNLANMIRHHHTPWKDLNKPISNDETIGSQIIFLADYIERLIDRENFILHQTDNIINNIRELSGNSVHPDLIDSFISISNREEFWLDLNSRRLYSILFKYGPLQNEEIDYENIELISMFFRDIIDFKSPFTATHTSGVAAAAEKLSAFFGLSEIEIQEMKIAGNFHDLGKLAIPNNILDKPGKLTKDEYSLIKSHTYYTYTVMSTISGWEKIAEWAAFHHEKLDGSGYPFHCDSSNMSTGSRIMAVADVFTALSEDRPYRDGLPKDKIISILQDMVQNNAIDKNMVSLLIDNYSEIEKYVKVKQQQASEFYKSRIEKINENI